MKINWSVQFAALLKKLFSTYSLECSSLKTIPLAPYISSHGREDINTWILCILDPENKLQIPKDDINNFQLFAVIAMDNLQFYRNQVVHDTQTLSFDQFAVRVNQTCRDHCKPLEWKEMNKETSWSPLQRNILNCIWCSSSQDRGQHLCCYLQITQWRDYIHCNGAIRNL